MERVSESSVQVNVVGRAKALPTPNSEGGSKRQNFPNRLSQLLTPPLLLPNWAVTAAWYASILRPYCSKSHGFSGTQARANSKEWRRLPRQSRSCANGAVRGVAFAVTGAEVWGGFGVG